MTLVKAPKSALGFSGFDARNSTLCPTFRMTLDRASSCKIARGETSPPYSLTRRSKGEDFPPRRSILGCPCLVTNRRSVSQPSTTRIEGTPAKLTDFGLAGESSRSSTRFISLLDMPVRAAIFDWLIRPFLSRDRSAAALMKASRASFEKLSGVIFRGSSTNASSTSSCSKSALRPSCRVDFCSRCPRRSLR